MEIYFDMQPVWQKYITMFINMEQWIEIQTQLNSLWNLNLFFH